MAFYIALFALTSLISPEKIVEAWRVHYFRNSGFQRMEYRELGQGLAQPLQKCYIYNVPESCPNRFIDITKFPNYSWQKTGTTNVHALRRVFDSMPRISFKLFDLLNRPLKVSKSKPSGNHYRSPFESFKNGRIPIATDIDIAKPMNHDNLNQSKTKSHECLIISHHKSLDEFEREFYEVNFNKFLDLTSPSKGDSGMSFVQSGLFLKMALLALSTEVDELTAKEIDKNFVPSMSDEEKVAFIKQTIGSLPNSTEGFTFRWSTRLVLRSGRRVSEAFCKGAANALQLKINSIDGEQTPEDLATALNSMIEMDSGGAMRETFEEEDLVGNIQAVLVITVNFRARWRSAPTLLNGTWEFHDDPAPAKPVRMIRVNDVMKYADLPEWDAQAIDIPYLTRGLSLLMLVPRGNSLRHLVNNVTKSDLRSVTDKMKDVRITTTLPLYTLRMTLLLRNKLEAMGIKRLLDANETAQASGKLRLTHAVQRLMFWSEAGRNAFKDDGLEWDEPSTHHITVDKPYIFFVRWQNITLMSGNFVL